MPEPALKRTVTVANRAGLHARAAVMVVTEARKFDAHVVLAKGLHEVEATEILQVMSLGAAQGEQLSLEVSGNEAQAAVDALEQLFLRKFDED
jgi:phosphotransferase system HPr (HPr) family protein